MSTWVADDGVPATPAVRVFPDPVDEPIQHCALASQVARSAVRAVCHQTPLTRHTRIAQPRAVAKHTGEALLDPKQPVGVEAGQDTRKSLFVRDRALCLLKEVTHVRDQTALLCGGKPVEELRGNDLVTVGSPRSVEHLRLQVGAGRSWQTHLGRAPAPSHPADPLAGRGYAHD